MIREKNVIFYHSVCITGLTAPIVWWYRVVLSKMLHVLAGGILYYLLRNVLLQAWILLLSCWENVSPTTICQRKCRKWNNSGNIIVMKPFCTKINTLYVFQVYVYHTKNTHLKNKFIIRSKDMLYPVCCLLLIYCPSMSEETWTPNVLAKIWQEFYLSSHPNRTQHAVSSLRGNII